MVGLYIHFPFCLSKCAYCDFNSYAGMHELYRSYLNALKTEIRLAADLNGDMVIDTLYFGGGTPTVFKAKDLVEIFLLCKKSFTVKGKVEVSIEANPETLNPSKLSSLRKAGFNRISIGMQSLDDDVLQALGRKHNRKRALLSYRWARRAGFKNINLDLIFGIEGQSIYSWRKTLHEVADLNPEHISAYPLELNRSAFGLRESEEDLQAKMFELTDSFLTGLGFKHYEISNFTRPGFESRHNLIYWNNGYYLGLGAGAHSHIAEMRFCNECDPAVYIKKLGGGNVPVCEKKKLAPREVLSESIFLGLRLLEGINLKDFGEKFGIDLVETFSSSITQLLEEGLVILTPERLKLSYVGRLLANRVFLEFL